MAVALQAAWFFNLSNNLAIRESIGKPISAGTIAPLDGSDFMLHLERQKIVDVWLRSRDVEAIVASLVRHGLMQQHPSLKASLVLPASYVWTGGLTRLQNNGLLWLAPVLGPELLVSQAGAITMPITGQNASGDARIATGIAVGPHHILTCAHVVNDMRVDDELLRPAVTTSLDATPHPAGPIKVSNVASSTSADVAVITVDPGSTPLATDVGLAFRQPAWQDDVSVLGYPPVATAGAILTMQRGQVVNPSVDSGDGELVLFSAIARPGNSGGPIIAADGRVIGMVTSDRFFQGGAAMPFYAGLTTDGIEAALAEMGYTGLLPLEDWILA